MSVPANSPIVRRRPDGDLHFYGDAAANAAAVGTALLAAQTASAAGDIISVFADAEITSPIGKNGVDWWFAPGVTVTETDDGPLFSDGGAAMTFSVGGMGSFIAGDAECVLASHASTLINIHAKYLYSDAASQSNGCVSATAGKIVVVADKVESGNYDAFLIPSGTGVIWFDVIEAITGGSDVAEASGGAIYGTAIYLQGDSVTAFGGTIRLSCQRLAVILFEVDGGAVEIYCPNITGRVLFSSGTMRINGAAIDSTALDAATITANGAGLTLHNCRLITKGTETNSLTASSAQTITVEGTLHYNKAKHANVTLASA